MNIKIIAVGKIKEKYTTQAINEFVKRLSGYCNLSLVEIPAQEIRDESLCEKYKASEAEKILSQIKQNSFVITLEILGKQLSSEEFSDRLKMLMQDGYNEIVFVIGGANGLHKSVSERADFKLSFSKMTFTHQLIRVFLYEQIYRAFKIINHEAYHR